MYSIYTVFSILLQSALTCKNITQDGQKGPLIFWDKTHWGQTIMAASYTEHIVPQMHAFWYEQSQQQLDYIYLQQDGASPHRAAYTQNQLKTLGIWGYFIDWPPSSPDCSPIENVWRSIKQRIRQCQLFPTTNESLRIAIQEEWDATTAEELRELVQSVPTRVREAGLSFSPLKIFILTLSLIF